MKTKIKVLIVDDSPADSLLLELYLAEDLPMWEAEIEKCISGESAMAKVKEFKPDVVLVDHILGAQTGLEVIDALKQSGCDSSFVLLTGISDDKAALEVLREGVDDCLSKLTLSPESLNRSLRLVTELKGTWQDRSLATEVFENSIEGIVVTDTNSVILNVNPAFCAITGYSMEEAIGNKSRMLRSDRHDRYFYKSMWDKLIATGHWEGEIWNRRKNGEAYPQWLTISSIKNLHGKTTSYVGMFHDMTEMKRKDDEIKKQAFHDALTGLPNRILFEDRLEQAVRRSYRHQKKIVLLFIDLDDFKGVNDTFGHSYGDILLQEVAKRLSASVRENDTVARLGGDEFTVILEDVKSRYDPTVIAKKIIKNLEDPIVIKEHETFIGASIGIAIYPDDGRDAETLIKNADVAMYKAKEEGRNNCQLYMPGLNDKIAKKLNMGNSLRGALEREEFIVHYQPKVDLKTNSIAGMEALLRWDKPGAGIVSPADFIPVAEETGLILPIGEWALRESCQQLAKWHKSGHKNLRLSVNLSVRQFRQDNLSSVIINALDEAGLDPKYLELEITESVVMHDIEKAIATMKTLRSIGVRFSIDDFGTGYSSLNYIKRFPIDTLKIDRSFICEMTTEPGDAAIVSVIIAVARSLDLDVIAEGVETYEQLVFLQEQNCDEIQGFIFSPALPPEAFYDLLNENRCLQAPTFTGLAL